MPDEPFAASKFQSLLRDQIRNEFTASMQYTAVAVYLDDQDLPQLAAHFYAQSLEERNHAMSMVQYLLDSDLPVHIPGVDDVRNDFGSVEDVVELALAQEKTVTAQITALARTARDEGDYLGEQFMQWFLKEQVEEVASMSTLLTVVRRAGDNLFHIEDFVARELSKATTTDPTTPPVAGGRV
ncbi:ferritin [Pseudonocardia saturnea]